MQYSPFVWTLLLRWLLVSIAIYETSAATFAGPAMRGPGRAAVFLKSREVACLRKFSFGNTATTPLPGATFSLWASSWDPFAGSVLVTVATDTPDALNESFVGDNFLQLSYSGQYTYDVNKDPPDRVLRQDSNWHHYIWSFNESARTVTWIIDGDLFYEGNYSHPRYGINDYRWFNLNLCLGNDQDAFFAGFSDSDMFKGAMESFSIWKTPVTIAQARAIMKGIPDAGLVAQRLAGWEFDDDPSQGPSFVSVDGGSDWTMFRSSGVGNDALDASTKGAARSDGCIMVNQQPSAAPIFHNHNPLLLVGFVDGAKTVDINIDIQAKSSDVSLQLASLPTKGSLSSTTSSTPYGASAALPMVAMASNTQARATIRYTAANNAAISAGDTFTVVSGWTSSPSDTTTLTVKLYLNSPPSTSGTKLDAKENKDYSFVFKASDADLDIVQFIVTVPPTKGTLKPAGTNPVPITTPNATISGYGALFTPLPDTSNAFEYTRFTVMAYDGVSYSDPVDYVIRVIPVNKLPALNTSVISAPIQQFTLAEDTTFQFTIPYTDPDSLTTGIQISQLPVDGTISVIYPGTTTPILLKSLATVAENLDQHLSEVVGVSTEYPVETTDANGNLLLAYGKEVLLDEQTELFADPESNTLNDIYCWYPDNSLSCTSLDATFFYTEWIHIKFPRPVSPTFLQLFICQGGTFNVRVRVKHPTTGAWHDLASLYTPGSDPPGVWVQKMQLCQTTFLVNEVKVDIDNCYAQEWKGIDHVKMQGFTAPPTSVFPQGTRFIYTPPPNYNGDFSNYNATINYTLTDCIGDSFRQTDGYTIAFKVTPVNDIPVAIAPADIHAVNAGQTNFVLSGTDIEAPPVLVNITTLPLLGTLYVNGTAVTTPNRAFTHPLTIGYKPNDPANCGNDPVTVVQNNVSVVLPFDTFTFRVIDNEQAPSPVVTVRIADVTCTMCVGEKILNRGRCDPCPGGYVFNNGACEVATLFEGLLSFTPTPTQSVTTTRSNLPPKKCSLPTLIPKGYSYDNVSCVGLVAAGQCGGLSCIPGYDGTPTVNCAINKGVFTIAGCSENVCSLPTLGPGYGSPAAGKCVGLLKVASCVLSCASGFTGTPKLSCALNASTFDMWGCQPNNCSLPSPALMSKAYSYDNESCAGPSTVSQCSGLSCAPGYSGAVAVSCGMNKGTFTLSGCSENVCVLPDLGPEFMPPTAGKCVGLLKAAGCTLTCNKGYTGAPKLFCATNATEFNVTGCRLNNCNLPLASAMIGYQTDGTCPGNQTVVDCAASVSCAPGYHGTANLTCASDKGKFVFGGCFDNLCSLPNPLPSGYVLPSTGKCLGPVKSSACTGLKCARGFSGTPKVFCQDDGGNFTISGCSPNNCTRGDVVGYSYSGSTCEGTVTAGTCSGHSCGPGFHGRPLVACVDNFKNLSLSGCFPNQCKMPVPLPAPYTLAAGKCIGYSTAAVDPTSKTTRKTDCLDVKCNVGYYGSPMLACPTDGQFFELAGCVENFCRIPAVMPVGYALSPSFATDCPLINEELALSPSDLSSCGGVVCAEGYNGPPVVSVCASKNSTFTFTGCSANLCQLPDPLPMNYQSSGECLGFQPVSSCKGVTCAVGVTPTLPAVGLSCVADLGEFTLAGCD